MLEITKVIEWDMGHRVPNHKNLCRNLHGHRYRLEVSVTGAVSTIEGASDQGMVIDFGELKQVMHNSIAQRLDHQFMYYEHDSYLQKFFSSHSEHFSAFAVPFIPTAENIVQWCFDTLRKELPPGLKLTRCKLYETPNSWAEVRCPSLYSAPSADLSSCS